MKSFGHLVLIVLCLGFAASAAQAQSYTIGPDGSDSDCIGYPTTPVCAVMTFIACLRWPDGALCEAVGESQSTAPEAPRPGHLIYSFEGFKYYEIGSYFCNPGEECNCPETEAVAADCRLLLRQADVIVWSCPSDAEQETSPPCYMRKYMLIEVELEVWHLQSYFTYGII